MMTAKRIGNYQITAAKFEQCKDSINLAQVIEVAVACYQNGAISKAKCVEYLLFASVNPKVEVNSNYTIEYIETSKSWDTLHTLMLPRIKFTIAWFNTFNDAAYEYITDPMSINGWKYEQLKLEEEQEGKMTLELSNKWIELLKEIKLYPY